MSGHAVFEICERIDVQRVQARCSQHFAISPGQSNSTNVNVYGCDVMPTNIAICYYYSVRHLIPALSFHGE